MRQLVGHIACTIREQRDECWYSVHLLCSVSPGPYLSNAVSQLGGPSHLNHNTENPHGYAQSAISWVLLNPVSINYNKDHLWYLVWG